MNTWESANETLHVPLLVFCGVIPVCGCVLSEANSCRKVSDNQRQTRVTETESAHKQKANTNVRDTLWQDLEHSHAERERQISWEGQTVKEETVEVWPSEEGWTESYVHWKAMKERIHAKEHAGCTKKKRAMQLQQMEKTKGASQQRH